MNENKGRRIPIQQFCNSRAFRRGYQDAVTGEPSSEDSEGHWRIAYIMGRQTVSFARGEGKTLHEVSPTKKLSDEVREAITIQAMQMNMATTDDETERVAAMIFLIGKGALS